MMIPILSYFCIYCKTRIENIDYIEYVKHLKLHGIERLANILIDRTVEMRSTAGETKEMERIDNEKEE